VEVILLLLVVGVVLWLVFRRRQTHQARVAEYVENESQAVIEDLALHYMEKYPNLSDAEIAQLLQDDLHNRRVRNQAAFRWASAETVGRVRRTVVRAILDDQVARPLTEAQKRNAAIKTLQEEPPEEDDIDEGGDEDEAEERAEIAARRARVKAGGVEIVRLMKCRKCKTKNKGDAYKCRNCGAVIGIS
jgi:hypothetical protein